MADIKYVYASHKMGKLDLENFETSAETPEEFIADFYDYVMKLYNGQFTMIAETSKGQIPVGIAMMIQPVKEKNLLFIGDLLWFPWASARNKLESTVHLLNALRPDWLVIEFARQQDKEFFNHICKYVV